MPLVLDFDALDDLGIAAIHAEDPQPYQSELLEAVEQGRVADLRDTTWALVIALGIAERRGEETEALAIAARAVRAAQGDLARGRARCREAALWLSVGHTEAGLRAFGELRPLLLRDPYASYLIDPLVEHGHAVLAEQWMTGALPIAMATAGRYEPGSPAIVGDSQDIADVLAIIRWQVRRDHLGLPLDEFDHHAAKVRAVRDQEADLLFWWEAAFTDLVAVPEFAEVLGTSWEDHRASIEHAQQVASDRGEEVVVEVGTPARLARLLGTEPPEGVPSDRLLHWPPGHDEPCWCGSGRLYGSCCLARRGGPRVDLRWVD